MAVPIKTPRMLGQPIKRREDPRLITGAGQYLDDITFPGMLHLAVVRSPYGHAKVNGIDTSEALKLPGVVAVFTASDIEGETTGSLPYEFGWQPFENVNDFDRGPLATDKVRYVGDPVAVSRPDGNRTPGELTLYQTTQNVHGLRKGIAPLLGYPENKVRVIVPDMGGGFGNRADCAPETVMTCIAAKRLGRPVKYQET